MKTAFISRFGGYGDIIHASHLPRLIKEYYGVTHLTFETGTQGYQILQNNPYIDKLIHIDVSKMTDNRLNSNWKHQEEHYDMFFNLMYSIEKNYCLLEKDTDYYRSSKYRREHCGKKNFYDVMTEFCKLPERYNGTRGMMYFRDTEHKKARAWIKKTKKKHKVDWIILVCLSGSSLHKRFQQAKSVCRKILKKYPSSLIILTGNKECEPQVFKHKRVISIIGKWNFRTTCLMSKYMDFVISPETGLVCVAHMWDTPTLQLLTAASYVNHIKYAKNAYWVRAPVSCSPCHKGPYKYYGCPRKDDLPECVFFNEDEIMEQVKEAYEHRTNIT